MSDCYPAIAHYEYQRSSLKWIFYHYSVSFDGTVQLYEILSENVAFLNLNIFLKLFYNLIFYDAATIILHCYNKDIYTNDYIENDNIFSY